MTLTADEQAQIDALLDLVHSKEDALAVAMCIGYTIAADVLAKADMLAAYALVLDQMRGALTEHIQETLFDKFDAATTREEPAAA